MYYKLLQDQDPESGYLAKTKNKHLTLQSGNILSKEDISKMILPWPFTLDPGFEDLKLSDYYDNVKLMSKKLIDTLKSVGVDNLQEFDTEVLNEQTGDKIEDYYAVNIVGLVSCVVEDQSSSTPLADVEFISDLVIDPAKAKGFNMFRLAETRMDVIVSEKVANAIKAGNFVGIQLEPIKELST